ncbi:MAG: PilZ domain-containing protein, partial [Hyphomicrobiaceae bacterium]
PSFAQPASLSGRKSSTSADPNSDVDDAKRSARVLAADESRFFIVPPGQLTQETGGQDKPDSPDEQVETATSGSTSPTGSNSQSAGQQESQPPGPPPPDAEASSDSRKRRDRRVPSQTRATLWSDRMHAPLPCVVRDKSSSGARLELAGDTYNNDISDIKVGEELTLTMTYARERSHVSCVIVWIADRQCGVRFSGQFHTQIEKSSRSKRKMHAQQSDSDTKNRKPVFGSAKSGSARNSK